ncbi:MAG TPA: hypothetical protein VF037_02345 [Gemmatimonadales bacterium]
MLVTGILVAAFGRPALLPGLAFGGLATVIQLVAGRLVRARLDAPIAEFGKRWAAGMALRLGGVVLVAVAAAAAPALFPPLPTAFGFLGVLIPLLFMEMRLAR